MGIIDFISNHTYITVLWGVNITGAGAAIVGTLVYLRGQTPLSDVVAHSSLPGTLIAFIFGSFFLQDARGLTLLTFGALATGLLGAYAANRIAKMTQLTETTAMALIATFMFAGGMLLMSYINHSKFSQKGGIASYLFGNAAQLTRADITLSVTIFAIVLRIVTYKWQDFTLATFDRDYAKSRGLNVMRLDNLLFALLAAVTVSGMRALGLLLILGFAVIPAAAARQWCKTLPGTVLLATIFSLFAATSGSYISVAVFEAPTGPLVVLILTAILLFSLLFAPERGMAYKLLGAKK